MRGIIKFFNETKGYGFIISDEGGKEIFVHASGLADRTQKPQAKDRVEFETREGRKGEEAFNVKPA